MSPLSLLPGALEASSRSSSCNAWRIFTISSRVACKAANSAMLLSSNWRACNSSKGPASLQALTSALSALLLVELSRT